MSILQGDLEISSPPDLVAVLRELKSGLTQGSLRQIDVRDPLVPTTSLIDIAEQGPWPDYIEAIVEDTEGHRYRLTVETFHGAGGSWQRI